MSTTHTTFFTKSVARRLRTGLLVGEVDGITARVKLIISSTEAIEPRGLAPVTLVLASSTLVRRVLLAVFEKVSKESLVIGDSELRPG